MPPPTFCDVAPNTFDIAALKITRFLIPATRDLPYRDPAGNVDVHLVRQCQRDVDAGIVIVDSATRKLLAKLLRHAERAFLHLEYNCAFTQFCVLHPLGEGRALRWFREWCSPQGRRPTHSSASRIAPRTAHGPEPQRCPFQKNKNHCRVAMQELENRSPRFLTGLPAPSSHEPAFQCVVASQMRPTSRFGPATYSRQVAAPSKSARVSRLASPRGPHA